MRIKDIMSTTRLMSFNSLTLHYFHTCFMSSHVLIELASVFFPLHEWIHLDWMGWLWSALEQVKETKSRLGLISDPNVLMDTSIIY